MEKIQISNKVMKIKLKNHFTSQKLLSKTKTTIHHVIKNNNRKNLLKINLIKMETHRFR